MEDGFRPAGKAHPALVVSGIEELCAAGSPQAQLADHLEKAGAGPATEWRLPSLADLDTLKAGWKSSDGTLRAWLQAKSGADPSTCKAVTAGSTEAVSDPKACVWPAISNLWSDP